MSDIFKKKTISPFASVLTLVFIIICLVIPALADAYQVTGKHESEEIITQGAVLQTLRLQTSEGPLCVYTIRVDLDNPYIEIDLIVSSDGTLNETRSVLAMGKNAGAVAAVNGDFFQINESKRPLGIVYRSGQMLKSPAQRDDMYGFALTMDKIPLFEVFSLTGEVLNEQGQKHPLSGINMPGYLDRTGNFSDLNALTIYNYLWGSTSRGLLTDLEGIVEALVQNGVVQQVLIDHPGIPLPRDGYIIRGHGQAANFIINSLPVGTRVKYDYSITPRGEELYAAVGGQCLLVENGRIPASFSQDIAGKHARTAAAVSRDGKTLYLVAVEKHTATDGSVLSRGMTQRELAEFLVSLGVWRAVNLDGGGSTTITARYLGDFELSLVNRPQALSMRAVPNAVGIFSTAPPGELKGLTVSGPSVLLVGSKGQYQVRGYDQYYNPYMIDASRVKWTAPPDHGGFTGNIFVPSRGGSVTLLAEMGSVSGRTSVTLVGPESLSGMVIKPSQINVEPGKSIKLSAQAVTKFGEYYDIPAGDVKWTVDEKLGSIVNGSFNAVKQAAQGEIKASFQNISASISVLVEPPAKKVEIESDNPLEILVDDAVKIGFPAGSVSEATTLKISSTGPPAEFLPGYHYLGSIAINSFGGCEQAFLKPFWIEWKHETGRSSGRLAAMMRSKSGNSWHELPSIVSLVNDTATILVRSWLVGEIILADDLRPQNIFSDTDGHWARQEIAALTHRGVISGYPNGTFGPQQPVTRAQFITMLVRALQWPSPEVNNAQFQDQLPLWAVSAVNAAVGYGIIAGYPDGTFRPDARITRSEMAVIIDRALRLELDGNKLVFKDHGHIPEFARGAVDRVSGAGLLRGSEGYFRPQAESTRAEAAAVIGRLLGRWVERTK